MNDIYIKTIGYGKNIQFEYDWNIYWFKYKIFKWNY